MDKKSIGRTTMIVTLAMMLIASLSYAGQIDKLAKELAKKGILQHGEAAKIITETNEEQRIEVAKAQKIKVKGDFRFRVQHEKKGEGDARLRYRIRFRWGGEAIVTEGFKVGFGLCTGGTDPRSTNQTLQNSFETPDIRLDYAYASWAAMPTFTLFFGKFKNPFWKPSDLLWDGDINIDGLAAQFASGPVFLNATFSPLDEYSGDTEDPMMYATQAGVNPKFGNNSFKAAATYYGFMNILGSALDHSEGGNTLDTLGGLMYEYNSVGLGGEFAMSEPFGGVVPYMGIFGEYVYNMDPDEDNMGYLGGIAFGEAKVSKKGHWQVKYMYRHLEKDAWLDIFPDSDAHSGATGIEGHECTLEVGLADNVAFGIDFYQTKPIADEEEKNGDDETKNLLQIDLNFKF